MVLAGMEGVSTRGELVTTAAGPGPGSEAAWRELLASVRRMVPNINWRCMAPEFYLTFWRLQLYDIHVPEQRCGWQPCLPLCESTHARVWRCADPGLRQITAHW